MIKWAPCFRHRDYRIYFCGQLANWFGTWIQQIALGWWAYKISGSVGWLAAVGACSQLPILFFGPWAASLSDHIELKRGVMVTQALSLAQAVALLALYATGRGGVEAIACCSLFLGVVNAFDIPIRQNYAARLIPIHEMRNAIAINTASANFARLAAPSLGGILIATAGEGACFAINAVSFLVILLALSKLPKQPAALERQAGSGALSLFAQGARHAAADPWILSSMGMACVLSLFATPYLTMMPALMRDAFKVGPEVYGVAMGLSGVGATLAGLAMATRPGMMGKRAMPWLGALGSVSLIGMVSMPSASAALPFLALTGFGLAGSASSANAVVQARVAPEMRGRVMGLFAMCLYGAAPVGVALMGMAANAHGTRVAVGAGAVMCLAGCLALAASSAMRQRKSAKRKIEGFANPQVKERTEEHSMVLPPALAAAAASAAIEASAEDVLLAQCGLDGAQAASEWKVPELTVPKLGEAELAKGRSVS